jgi:hypothetical protein
MRPATPPMVMTSSPLVSPSTSGLVLLLALDLRADHQEVENDDQADRKQQTQQRVAGGGTPPWAMASEMKKLMTNPRYLAGRAAHARRGMMARKSGVQPKFSRAL